LRSSEKAWRAWLERESRIDISAFMPNVAVPVLVLSGENDKGIDKNLLEREVVRRIKGAKLIVLADAGHLLPLEVPETAAKLIAKQIEFGHYRIEH
jgi:pimeloyl-ACP methyl ester carboxylesterase